MIQKKKTKVRKYRLFAAKCTQQTVEIAMNTPYARIANGYILLYKSGKAPEGYTEMTDKAEELLSDTEKAWLRETNLAIMEEFLKKNAQAARRGMIAFGKRFRENLEKEMTREAEAETDEG